jgi:hypothetical protein
MKLTKLLILLGFMSLMTSAYACRTVIIDTPTGSTVCFICSDGKYINCEKL